MVWRLGVCPTKDTGEYGAIGQPTGNRGRNSVPKYGAVRFSHTLKPALPLAGLPTAEKGEVSLEFLQKCIFSRAATGILGEFLLLYRYFEASRFILREGAKYMYFCRNLASRASGERIKMHFCRNFS